ncbi:MAG: altronate dehydratase family protein [Defluviitaleaceae bacterium]|nr:altronate dehydratase family protein [Defluviitaleaceae bacterium]
MNMLKIHPTDNVAVALEGEHIRHKIALAPIKADEQVIKYGYPIGTATADIPEGAHVHTHNMRTNLSGIIEYAYEPTLVETPIQRIDSTQSDTGTGLTPDTFMGYKRANGKVGIRNEVWVVPTVGCINITAERIAQYGRMLLSDHEKNITRDNNTHANGTNECINKPNDVGVVDGVYAFGHPYGCSQMGDDQENTRRAIAGLLRHPNAAQIIVLGLGCETNDITSLQHALGDFDMTHITFIQCQDSDDEIAEGEKAMRIALERAQTARRESVPMGELIVGLKCGGSDGFSGITANPLCGAFADRLIAEGGAIMLTEVPEMFGAETILMNRCATPALFDRTVCMINDFKQYFLSNGQSIYENPSPGNKAGGITTLEDKSLGCVQKGGTTNVTDVLAYGQPLTQRGLNLLDGPGNDLVSISAMTASGAHLILFTTGLGTPFGAPAPTVKISSNTALYGKKPRWIDFDAGQLLAGVTMPELSDQLYEYVRALASGEITAKNEDTNAREFTIFKTGITL